ncbi:UbiX family flavin prenyltransferase [Collinsella sp. SGI.180]|uniref:UbiX family flavin prenyltransferase n=1 Tax=unclassified Collinsella TaxID=2637548 RepID=UPI003CFFFA4A
MAERKRIVVGVSGASGSLLGLECLKCMREAGAESHLVVSRGAEVTIKQELGMTLDEFMSYGDVVYDNRNIGASIASGTFPIDGMIVAPCSMKTLAGIASGYSENLLLRAADVQMKEQRRLVLMVRETPFSAIHVDNMARLARVPGVMLMPPMLTFYNGPATLDDAVHHIAAKALEAVGVSCANYKRWS